MRGLTTTGFLAFLLAVALSGAVGCASEGGTRSATKADFSSPRATLDTFFESARRLDYKTTYSCYDQPYQERISEKDFVDHRTRAAILRSYRIDSLSVGEGSAVATVTLTFAPEPGGTVQGKTIQTRENLVKQAASWKVRVW